MDIYNILFAIGTSIIIGALIGLEREKAKQYKQGVSQIGIRTDILICLFGAISAFLGKIVSPVLFFICLSALILLTLASYIYLAIALKRIGITTEISTIVVFLLGAIAMSGYAQLALILAILITLILSIKTALHHAITKINSQEIYDTIKFAIIAFIILPFLPNQNYDHQIYNAFLPGTTPPAAFDQIQVLNPYNIWFLAVLVSGISFLGYILVKTIGNRKGITISGLIGGLYSSTATSLSLAVKSKSHPEITTPFISGIVLACGVSFLRTFIFIRALNADLFNRAFIPVMMMFLYLMGVGTYMFFHRKKVKLTTTQTSDLKTPFELTAALKLGGFITGALLISKMVLTYASVNFYYIVAALMAFLAIDDPFIISSAASAGKLITMTEAKNVILLVTFLNMFQKVFLVYIFGNRKLFKPLLKIYGGLFLVSLIGFIYF
jgi:uncharacterized membrane protein (DUF4010 family)